jgi:hypothetical protein
MPVKLPADETGKKGYFLAKESWQKFRTNFKKGDDLKEELFDKNFYVTYKNKK